MSLLSRTMDLLRGRRRPEHDADGWPVDDNASFRRTVPTVDRAADGLIRDAVFGWRREP